MNITEAENLALCMSGGLLPEQLNKSEVSILEEAYGKDWFTYMGYSEPDYKKPTFE